MYIKIF